MDTANEATATATWRQPELGITFAQHCVQGVCVCVQSVSVALIEAKVSVASI